MNIEEQKQIWEAELAANESVQKYFSQFTPYSVDSFVKDFLFKKSMWMQYAKRYIEEMETDGVKWVYSAFNHLQTIQQKKLFDIQCLWRAEKLTIKEVQICADFLLWENNILNCPFLEPVSMEDIELYQTYLQQENKEEPGWLEHWQDYDEIKEAYYSDNQNRNFPEWYDFYNGRKGTGVLMTLPNIRGEKEEFYRELVHQQNRINNAARDEEWERTRDKRSHLSSYHNMEWFVNTFEDKESQYLYKAFEWKNRNRDKEEILEEDLALLFSADEPVPVPAHYNWIEAIQKAAENYRSKKIIEAIPQAWEQYMINIQTGIAFERNRYNFQSTRDMVMQSILEGRVLNGEPADLNF